MRIKNNIKLIYFILFSFFMGIFCLTTTLNAEKYTGYRISPEENISGLYIKKQVGSKTQYRTAHFMRRSSDGMFVYCLQPLADIDNNYVYNIQRKDYLQVINMSEEQWERITLLAYYGYGYGSHTDAKWYMITQIMIWRTIEPTGSFEFTDGHSGPVIEGKFSSEMAELEELLVRHFTFPELKSGEIVIPLGQTITLTDTNNVLSEFKVKSANNVNASINGNSLTITATGIGNANIRLAKEDSLCETPPIVYYNAHSQDVMSRGSLDPLYDSLNIKVIGGRVEITKHDKDTGQVIPQGLASLENAEYGIYNATTNELVTTIKTDNNAYAISDYLPSLGDFYLQELSPSLGYQLDKQKYYFTIDEDNLLVHMDVYEEVITRTYNITKVYATDKTEIMTPEIGVEFGIYDHNDNLILTKVTDNEGRIEFTLPYGNYILRQLSTPSGYEKIEDYYFEIKDMGSTINKVFSNAEITARLKVIKIDEETGKVINRPNIKFKIFDVTRNEYVCQTVMYPEHKTYCEFMTDKNGVFMTPYPLSSGKYRLEEVDQVIDGYVWNQNSNEFEIGENSELINDNEYGILFETKFANKPVKGKVLITKLGEEKIEENGKVVYKEVLLDGVEYELYANDNITSADGTLIYKKGTLIGTYKTRNGIIEINNMYLGKYYLIEKSTVNNHILDTEKHFFELKYKDQYTEIIEIKFNFKNYLPKGKLEFLKTDELGNPLAGVKINLYKEDGTLVGTYTTMENGKIIVDNLEPNNYVIKELSTIEGYELSEDVITFSISEVGETINVTMVNNKLPQTDLNDYTVVIATTFIIFGMIMFLINILLRKKGGNQVWKK